MSYGSLCSNQNTGGYNINTEQRGEAASIDNFKSDCVN